MRILVGTGLNQGEAEYKNFGDVAMLQVAVSRLAELWPDSDILVLTDSEDNLARFCPKAKACCRVGAVTWLSDGVITGPLHLHTPDWITALIRGTKRCIRRRAPGWISFLLRNRFRLHDGEGRGPKTEAFARELERCDLLVIAGCGGFADSCREWNVFALNLIEAVLTRRKPVALFSQGLGPISDEETLNRMGEVLPQVRLLASRGTQGAEVLAAQIGVSHDIFVTTGDDAVEPAARQGSEDVGHGVGINLRIAPYSGITDSHSDLLSRCLRQFATQQGADLVPLPIAVHQTADDRDSIAKILGDGLTADTMARLDSPEAIYQEVAKCRVVVAGAYHAAVFALGQGIPTICLYGAEYYKAKFEGLQALFGEGCAVIDLHEADSMKKIQILLEQFWDGSTELRVELRAKARGQVEASRDAYRRLHDSLETGETASQSEPA
ncbi:polysaccharide pyruvyl transferase family protein [Occallatibacter savannae]|uniref:polysaccharide pyruvyl transferase family protein n=1 Tax=Occallatibacter savannae TaxID=1002691 RepID=UPI000D698D6E|nr:polysaccharide pyruvyl transferase family protein [Occallatibacter savannae]